jgi:chromosome segregation ATPase
MSIRSNTGIQIPSDNLEQADKSTLISIIEQLTTELSSVKSEVSDIRQDSDRNSREIADTNGRVSEVEDEVEDIHENVDRASKKIADTNGRVSDLEDNTDTSDCEASGSDNSTDNPNVRVGNPRR